MGGTVSDRSVGGEKLTEIAGIAAAEIAVIVASAVTQEAFVMESCAEKATSSYTRPTDSNRFY